jgi:ATP-dependent DNA helicase RecG
MEPQDVILNKPVKYLKTVGPKRASLLNKLGVFVVRDLLTYYPREWIDRTEIKKIAQLRHDETTTIFGRVQLSDVVRINPKLVIFKAAIADSTGVIYAVQYKQFSYRYDVFKNMRSDFTRNNKMLIYGKIEQTYGNKQIIIKDYEVVGNEKSDFIGILPVYPLTERLNIKFLRKLVRQTIRIYVKYCPEILPEGIIEKYGLMHIRNAMEQIHFPDNFAQKDLARKRLAFDDFLLLELAVMMSRKQIHEIKKSYKYEVKKHLLKPFKEALGFEFTRAQKKVINEIFSDLTSNHSMNRLLLGDVGSGKTVVALSAVLLAIENGCQAALMAPTEILAEQHYYTVKNFFHGLNIVVELLTGTTSRKEKKCIIDRISSGRAGLVIGTHALIEEDVKFKKLALAVIDEQHKFGVIQRLKLHGKAFHSRPDVLIMTATPIPRTLALTLYSDIDISIIDELPPGRVRILTRHIDEHAAYEFVKSEIDNGRQAYVVFPLVNESDKLELRSAIMESKKLKNEFFSEYKIGLLHGQLPGKQKEKTMIEFRDGKYDILITTTVIEVGIDVPNATVMVIHHADRFGLATLHQLRGRIGRSEKPSTCFILGTPKTDEAKRRFEIFCSTNDGPGDFFGTAQHGLYQLKIGNILTDKGIISQARKCASEIVSRDKFLSSEKHRSLGRELIRNYGGKLSLPNVG